MNKYRGKNIEHNSIKYIQITYAAMWLIGELNVEIVLEKRYIFKINKKEKITEKILLTRP